MLNSSNRSTRCHQASIFSHSTSSVEKLLFLGAHPLDDVSESQQFVPDISNGTFEIAIETEMIVNNSPRSNMLEGYLMDPSEFKKCRSSPKQIEGPDGRNLQLHFRTRLSLSHFTGGKVEGEQGAEIHVVLIDANTGHVVTSGPESSAKLEVVVLEGDFSNEDNDDWTEEEFDSHVVKEREGKRPLLIGDLYVSWKEGVGTLGELTFPDNSSWIRSRKFRLGLKIASGFCDGIRVREAKTEAFTERTTEGNCTRNTIHLN
ncbi:unnamed protein product [Musa acuminata subsp. burmannicoides]